MSKEDKQEQVYELINELSSICEKLGWNMVIPQDDSVGGIIIGHKDFLSELLGEDFDEYYDFVEKGGGSENLH